MPIPLPSSGALATRSNHRVINLVVAARLVVVLLAPLRVAGVIVVAVVLAWWFADSLHREGM
ncbi:MAG: hypothetical protein ACR2H9_14605 [Longimicrobiaceae bacterium]